MKRILMIFSFVSVSLFSFCQTNVNYNFTKSFTLTEWYDVKSAISYDLVTYKCSQDVLDISENLLSSPVKCKITYNAKNKLLVLGLTTKKGYDNTNFDDIILEKKNIHNGESYSIIFKEGEVKFTFMRFDIHNNNTCTIYEFERVKY